MSDRIQILIPVGRRLLRLLGLVAFIMVGGHDGAWGQEAEFAVEASEIQSLINEPPSDDAPPPVAEPSGVDLLSLITRGGGFMIPIGLMSLLVVTLAVERLLSLRRKKVTPTNLMNELESMVEAPDQFNPTTAYHICQEYPSVASKVITSMLLRTGQSLGEIERAATEAAQREADVYAGPIRWLNLAAAATPLMGLLGTVWGMIVAFHESTTLTPDRSRSEQLSEGIYTALVTTLAGLAVAIPAAILAQYLENRLATLFHRVEQLAFDIAPGLARFTGRSRLDSSGTLKPLTHAGTPPVPPPVMREGDEVASIRS